MITSGSKQPMQLNGQVEKRFKVIFAQWMGNELEKKVELPNLLHTIAPKMTVILRHENQLTG